MVANKKKFSLGLIMFIGFYVVVVLLFMPVSNGKNMFNVLDDLYNSVSKSSSYFIPEVEENAKQSDGKEVSFTAKGTDADQAKQIATLFEKNGATATASDKSVKVSGDLGKIIAAVLADSDAMFYNRGKEVSEKYGFSEKEAMNSWWNALNSAQKDLTANDKFDDSKTLKEVNEKAVEPAYNYYGIDAQSPREKALPILLSLGGYILYTVWYGFGLLFMFEGWGLKLEH